MSRDNVRSFAALQEADVDHAFPEDGISAHEVVDAMYRSAAAGGTPLDV